MIKIKMHNEKWKIEIQEEEFEFINKIDMNNTLQILLELKDKHGRIKC